MWILWDIIAVVIIVLFVYFGAKKGFIRTLVSLLCYVAAMVLAGIIGPRIAVFLYDTVFSQSIAAVVHEQLGEALKYGISSGVEIMEQLPVWLIGIITSYYPDFKDLILTTAEGQEAAILDAATVQVTQALAAPVIQILTWVLFLLLFMVLAIAIKQLAKLFTGVNKIPVVGTLNMTLGGFLGAFQAVVVLVIICIAVVLFHSLSTSYDGFFSRETINSSFIMGTINRLIEK